MPAWTAEGERVKRLVCLFALMVPALGVTALAGCKDAAPGSSASLATALVRPGTDIVLRDVRAVAPGDDVADAHDEFYVVTLNFTNHLGYALAPRPDHFVFEDAQKIRYLGAVSGNANLSGIANYAGVLKVGDSHDYTIGFRVPQNAQGVLYYDATF